jgi:uncharacterized repeat protein (TIGR01451 family)
MKMKLLNPIRLSVGLAALFVAQAGWAVGTDAGTVVENTATLNYSVGGVPQTAIDSPVADFTVDRKIDLTVDGIATTNYLVSPLSTKTNTGDTNVLKYKLLNAGNAAQDFEVTAIHLGSEEFDALACEIEIRDSVGGTTVATGGTATAITNSLTVNIPEDTEYEVRVACDMPDLGDTPPAGGLGDGDLSTIEVLATAVDGTGDAMEESATDAEDAIDVVLADGVGGAADIALTNTSTPAGVSAGVRNASHSDVQTFEIQAPELSVEKTSAVVSDPLNNTTNPKRIPGAIIEYTITVKNDSDDAVTGVAISDVIADEDVVVNYIGNPSPASVTFNDTTDTVSATVDVPAHDGTNPGEVSITFQVEIL